jgi:hypothetical protein
MACLDDQDAAAVSASWIGSTIEGTSFSGVNTESKDELRSTANGILLCAKHPELFKERPFYERLSDHAGRESKNFLDGQRSTINHPACPFVRAFRT